MDRLLRRLGRAGVRNGLSGGHAGWLLLALAAYGLRHARRAGDPVALSVPIRAGDRLLVTLVDPTAQRSTAPRRAAKR